MYKNLFFLSAWVFAAAPDIRATDSIDIQERTEKVVIVGAGMAGLTAGYDLAKERVRLLFMRAETALAAAPTRTILMIQKKHIMKRGDFY